MRLVDHSRVVVAGILLSTVMAGSADPARATTLNLQVGSSQDDYKQSQSGSSVKTDTTLDLWTTSDQQVALRFLNVTVPKSAHITSATLQVYSPNTGTSNDMLGTVRGEKVVDAPAWTGASNEISAAPKTSAVAVVDNPPTWTGNAHNDLADVTAVVQEIVDLCDWESGNAMKLFLIAADQSTHRRTHTYDSAPSKGAKLIIEYELCNGAKVELSTRDETSASIDLGWNGIGHNGTSIARGATLTATLSSCEETSPPCGACDFTGPIQNICADKGVIDPRRCSHDTRAKCVSDVSCGFGSGNTCDFYFGSYVSLPGAGCIANKVAGALTGAADLDSGDLAVGLPLTTTYTFGVLGCPICDGDATPNDGVRGGTCDAGPNIGLSCDVNGGNNSQVPTSLDCPPVAGIPTFNLLNASTTSQSITLSASNPACGGDPTKRCLCSTCNNLVRTACSTNADCPQNPSGTPGVCGGKMCMAGSNMGKPCTTPSQCPGGSCQSWDAETKPNACLDDTTQPGVSQCQLDGGEYRCVSGPIVRFCSTGIHKSCGSNGECAEFFSCSNDPSTVCDDNADCGGAPCQQDTCSSEFRPCFEADGATSGPGIHSITAAGSVATPVSDEWDATVVNPLVCIPPLTGDFAGFNIVGLPGPSRLELPLHVKVRR